MDSAPMDSKLYIDLIGKPYKANCSGPDYYNCFGLVMEIYRRMGVELPNVNEIVDFDYKGIDDEFARNLPLYIKLTSPYPGCIIAFKMTKEFVTHVGVVLDHCNMIHIRRGIGVSITRFDSPLWKSKLEGYYTYG